MRRTFSLLAAAGIVAALAGCSDGPAAPIVSAPTDEERAQWGLPLDPYIGGPADVVTTDYAENLLITECMTAQGIDWPMPAIDVATLHSDTMSPSGRMILTVQTAQTYGYHSDRILPDDVAATLTELNEQPISPQAEAAFSTCLDQARETIPLPDISQLGVSLANTALDEAATTPEAVAAAAQWHSCMAGEGVSDLPDAPYTVGTWGMPSESLTAKFGLNEPGSTPSAEEIALATADANCRVDSGYDEALYNAEWKAQSDALIMHADELEREREAQETRLEQARAVIADRTGA